METLIYLLLSGKKGFFTTVSGLKIAYLSGCESPGGSAPSPKHCFSQDDITALKTSLNATSKQYKGIDVLLTSTWPKGVTTHGNPPVSTFLLSYSYSF